MATQQKLQIINSEWRRYPNANGHVGAVQNQSDAGITIYIYITKKGQVPTEDDGILIDTTFRTLPIVIADDEEMYARTASQLGYVRLI